LSSERGHPNREQENGSRNEIYHPNQPVVVGLDIAMNYSKLTLGMQQRQGLGSVNHNLESFPQSSYTGYPSSNKAS
jgi:hypothetical protein